MRPITEQEIALTVVWVRDIRVSNYFKFVAAFPSWTASMNNQFISEMVHGFGRENVRARIIKRKAALLITRHD